jgi:hypothetical protein
MGSGSYLFIDGLQRSSANMHHHFAFDRSWFRKLSEAWKVARSTQYGGVHPYLPMVLIKLSVNSVVLAVPPTSRVSDFPSR